ncbi:MAG: hypothetical protein ACRD1F_01765 [Terriglobales bacterium]
MDSSTLQSLAGALTGGLMGYVDSQNGQPITATLPGYQTAYGYAGVGQPTPLASASASIAGISPTVLVIGVVLVAAFMFMRR